MQKHNVLISKHLLVYSQYSKTECQALVALVIVVLVCQKDIHQPTPISSFLNGTSNDDIG